ncbi:MAG: SA1362 family protein [Tuberibacillus sp.]
MKFSWSRIIFSAVIGLAIIGLFSALFTNPIMLFTRILIGAAVIGIIIFVYKIITGQSRGADAGYRRAVRQSKKRLRERERNHGQRRNHLQVIPSKALMKKRTSKRNEHGHLKVIEGKKKGKRNSTLSR